MRKNVLIKMQKPELYYCPDGLLVQLSAFQAERPGLNPTCANFCFFFLNLFSTANWYQKT